MSQFSSEIRINGRFKIAREVVMGLAKTRFVRLHVRSTVRSFA